MKLHPQIEISLAQTSIKDNLIKIFLDLKNGSVVGTKYAEKIDMTFNALLPSLKLVEAEPMLVDGPFKYKQVNTILP